ncbi:flagellar basal-body rod protein FlgG [Fusibacter tunisiensis]|uniref:Flagellar basal-body rod protein FlgG n=1 Tax=Fusibacter tunisiensis TaxID=1008308 RepID=A0ABS2MPH6_9FIRM|nr:flagellar basal-body rod protein FlgG [Fusibacter tunisiensis]MBM7561309.1 flagellar basal-body rod protein FlgG [Fusibacter tunisiensis]
MKAMWSAASGMKNLQLKIDTISNNLANVNTVGYKNQRVEFKDIMYERLFTSDKLEDEGRPVPIEVGHGVMVSATLRSFATGNLQQTEGQFDFAINGDHFFKIIDPYGNERYTKDGNFKLAATDEGAVLVTSDGYYVQGSQGNIVLGEDVTDFAVDGEGNMRIKRLDDETYEDMGQMTLVKFINASGLEAMGKNLFKESVASGVAIEGLEEGDTTEIMQGFIENSNVQIVDEMINLITAERAYEINSKSIQTADRMLEIANNLKR